MAAVILLWLGCGLLVMTHSHSMQTGLLPCVCPLVSDEIEHHTEASPTLPANIGLLPCVCPLVSDEIAHHTEASPTLPANIGLLPCVCPLVCDET